MKNILKVGLLATLVLSGAAMADQYRTSSTNQSALYTSDSASSQAEAAEIATRYVDALQNMDAFELSQKLPTPHRRIDKRSVELDNTEVEVIAQEGENGNMEYFAQVLIDYSYEYRSSKNRSGGVSSSTASVSGSQEPDTTPGNDSPGTDVDGGTDLQ